MRSCNRKCWLSPSCLILFVCLYVYYVFRIYREYRPLVCICWKKRCNRFDRKYLNIYKAMSCLSSRVVQEQANIRQNQGFNARKVISVVDASFVLQCTVTGRMSKTDMGSIFHIKNQWNILDIGNNYVNYQNY